MVHNLRSEFDPHRHLRRRQVLIFITREFIDKVIAYSFCYYKRKRKYNILLKNCMFKLKINLNRYGPRPLSNI
jgi:hypothetical protein